MSTESSGAIRNSIGPTTGAEAFVYRHSNQLGRLDPQTGAFGDAHDAVVDRRFFAHVTGEETAKAQAASR